MQRVFWPPVALLAVSGVLLVLAVVPFSQGKEPGQKTTPLPAEELQALAGMFLNRIQETTADEATFDSDDSQNRRYQNAHALALVAAALGQSEDAKARAAAGALWKAALELSDVGQREQAQALLQQARDALDGKATGGKVPAWNDDVAELDGVMPEVGNQQNRINRSLRRLRRRPQRVQQAAVFLAATARLLQAQVPDEDEAEPDQIQVWKRSAALMEQAARELYQAARAKDTSKARAANKRLDQSCHQCHEAFGIDE